MKMICYSCGHRYEYKTHKVVRVPMNQECPRVNGGHASLTRRPRMSDLNPPPRFDKVYWDAVKRMDEEEAIEQMAEVPNM